MMTPLGKRVHGRAEYTNLVVIKIGDYGRILGSMGSFVTEDIKDCGREIEDIRCGLQEPSGPGLWWWEGHVYRKPICEGFPSEVKYSGKYRRLTPTELSHFAETGELYAPIHTGTVSDDSEDSV